jgi:hypothetical protein
MNLFTPIALFLVLLAQGERLQASPLFEVLEPIAIQKPKGITPEPIPVDPEKKYLLTFSANSTGESTLEANPRVSIQVKKGFASQLVIEFCDAGGGKAGTIEASILSKSPRLYGRAFYPPPAATHLKLNLIPAKGEWVEVQNVRLTQDLPELEKAAINPHPTFEFGNLNGYGYILGYGGGVYTRPDGKTVLNTGFAGISPVFPVKPDIFYEIYCRGILPLGRKSNLTLQCFGEDSKKPIKSMRVNVSNRGETTKLLLPLKTKQANFLFYHVILEELRVVESSAVGGAENSTEIKQIKK